MAGRSIRLRRRWLLLLAALAVTVVVGLTVPLPSAVELRDAARAAGVWAPLAFLVAHAVITVTPLPRTVFTLAGGLMFGPWVALPLCVVASTISAAVAFAIVRRLGGRAVARLGPARVRAVEARLSGRGLLSVCSVRLVPALPFAPVNYAFGLSTVRWRDFILGTVVGLVPGTIAVVLLGDAVTGRVTPAMAVTFVISGAIGCLGVLVSARPVGDQPVRPPEPEPD